MWRRGLTAAGLAAAIAGIALVALLPPAALTTGAWTPAPAAATVRGAFHVHSVRSDGSGTVEEIAAAASRAGLRFVILTDHGDATRHPDPPRYLSGVLAIDAVELNTVGGHLAALGLPQAPYPIAGTAADAIEDVHRLGGMAIAAHPGSPRVGLSWRAWDAPIDGLEWINADSEWRDEGWWPVARAVFTALVRPTESITTLLDRPDAVLERWDAANRTRRVVALAGADAHARLALRPSADPDPAGTHVPWPGYEDSFRTFSNHVILDRPWSGDADTDAADLIDAIRHGRVYGVVDGLATPGGLEFTATAGGEVAAMGADVPTREPVTLRVRVNAPPGAVTVLLRDGRPIRDGAGDIEAVVEGPAAFRVEVRLAAGAGAPAVPWIVSNPIYVGFARPEPVAPVETIPLARIPARIMEASPERGPDDASTVAFVRTTAGTMAGEPPAIWTYELAGGPPRGQFAALQVPVTGGLADFDRVRFRVVSEGPVRVWLQLRVPGDADRRWGRTFYADATSRLVDLPFAEFIPVGGPAAAVPLDQVDSLLVVADTVNTRPGATGMLTISELAFVR